MGLPHLAEWVRVGVESLPGYVRLLGADAAGPGAARLRVEAVGSDSGKIFDAVNITVPASPSSPAPSPSPPPSSPPVQRTGGS
jgi:hypothetical protein